MARKHRIDNLLKRLERRVIRKSFISVGTIGDLRPDKESISYDYQIWKHTGELREIDKTIHECEYTQPIFVMLGCVSDDGVKCGYVPPNLRFT